MSDTNSNSKNEEPKLRSTLKNDLKKGDFFKTLSRDFKDLKEYYISEEKHKRLSRMSGIKRIFMFSWWLLKSMILKLTPLRRIILVIGILFLIFIFNVSSNGDGASSSSYMLGVILILFVLMLELKDKLLAHDELEAGRKIQNALMPEESPQFSGWSLMLFTRSANEVSGDLVDFIKIEPGKAGLLIADVAGKGLKAALLTSKLQATVRSFVEDYQIENLVSKVNDIFYRDSLRNIFASLLYMEISENSGQLKYVNAGHLPPLYNGADGLKEMSKGDAALGLMKGVNYHESILELKSGEFSYT
ncbi:MAG: PP2C family protein-serine/threonine phosphatase [Ignavibacteriae bacterium]|nr:PP2C family protein-serine/threonine phosphatase [Ignavibacteriota bacterium]